MQVFAETRDVYWKKCENTFVGTDSNHEMSVGKQYKITLLYFNVL